MAKVRTRLGKRITRKNQGTTKAGLRAQRLERLARAPVYTRAVVQPNGVFKEVDVRLSDLNKIKARDRAMNRYYKGDKSAIERYNKRYARPYVIDRSSEEPQAIHLILDPNELTASRNRMTQDQLNKLAEMYKEQETV
jgi:hypothetical protein